MTLTSDLSYSTPSLELRPVDVNVQRDNGLFVFTPNTVRAAEWLHDNVVSEDWQWIGFSLIVDHHYAVGLAQHLIAEGYKLA